MTMSARKSSWILFICGDLKNVIAVQVNNVEVGLVRYLIYFCCRTIKIQLASLVACMEMTTLPRLEIEPQNFHFHNIQMVVSSSDPPWPHPPHAPYDKWWATMAFAFVSHLIC